MLAIIEGPQRGNENAPQNRKKMLTKKEEEESDPKRSYVWGSSTSAFYEAPSERHKRVAVVHRADADINSGCVRKRPSEFSLLSSILSCVEHKVRAR